MGYLMLVSDLINSDYYKWVLSANDKITLQTLMYKSLRNNTKSYNNGLIVVNAKLRTLYTYAGMTYSTFRNSLNRLIAIGVIVKLKRVSRNNRYFIGFRTKSNDNIYLINHLITKYKQQLQNDVEEQLLEFKKSYQTPTIDTSKYRIDEEYRQFIFNYFDQPNELLYKRLSNGKIIMESLFNRKDIYRKTFPGISRVLSFQN